MEYHLESHEVEIPKNTGIKGFLYTVEEILKLPRLQTININAKGKVRYERYVADGEEIKIGLNFEGLEPWHVIRNGEVEELVIHSSNPMSVLADMFDLVSREKFIPIAWVTGANSVLEPWIAYGTGRDVLPRPDLFGLPVYRDRNCPDTALVLCTAYAKGSALVDTQKSYKIEMDITFAPDTTVEVF